MHNCTFQCRDWEQICLEKNTKSLTRLLTFFPMMSFSILCNLFFLKPNLSSSKTTECGLSVSAGHDNKVEESNQESFLGSIPYTWHMIKTLKVKNDSYPYLQYCPIFINGPVNSCGCPSCELKTIRMTNHDYEKY